MNRREMLHQSLQELVTALPAMLGVLGGLYGSMTTKEGKTLNGEPTCFPKGHKKAEALDDQRTDKKEE
jgi:hypothetical protein